MKKYIQKLWKDPVFSKLIAFIFIGLITTFYNLTISYFNKTNFIKQLLNFWNFKIELWIITLFILIYYISNFILKKRRKDNFTYDEKTLILDSDLFQKIRTEIMKPEDVNNLKTHTFSQVPFNLDELAFIDRIKHNNRFPEFEFLNPTLEALKKELTYSIEELEEKLGSYIFGTDIRHQSNIYVSIPREWDSPKRQNAQIEIELKEKKVSDCYDSFIKTGRRILKK